MADISEKLADLSKEAVDLRDKQELPWHEIAGQLGVSVGKALLAYEFGKVKPKDRVSWTTDAQGGKLVAAMRDKEGLSWGRIQARTGQGEQYLRRLYEEHTGSSTMGNRIGKGGRYPGQAGAPRKATGARKAPAKKATAAKKAPAKKAAARKVGAAKKSPTKRVAKKAASSTRRTTASGNGSGPKKDLVDMDYDELSERLEGKRIGVQIGDSERTTTYTVRSVKELDGNNVSFIDAKSGNTRTIKVDAIKRASK